MGEGGNEGDPVRAESASAPLFTSVLSLSFSVWEMESIGKRNVGEDRLLIIYVSICPSSGSPVLTAGNGWGWNERLIRDQVPPIPPTLGHPGGGRHRCLGVGCLRADLEG